MCACWFVSGVENLDQIRNIIRPTDVPDTGLLCDLVWSDPEKFVNGWMDSDRGISYTFGENIVKMFMKKHDFHTFFNFQVFWKNLEK